MADERKLSTCRLPFKDNLEANARIIMKTPSKNINDQDDKK